MKVLPSKLLRNLHLPKRYRFVTFGSMLYLAASNFIFSYMLQRTIDSASMGNMSSFLLFAGFFLLASLLYGAAYYLNSYYGELLTQAAAKDLKAELYYHIVSLPREDFLNKKVGFWLTTLFEDADLCARYYVEAFLPLIQLLLSLLIGVVYTAVYSWELLIVVVLFSAVLLFIYSRFNKRISVSYQTVQLKSADQKEFATNYHENAAQIKIFSPLPLFEKSYQMIFSKKSDAVQMHNKNKTKSALILENGILWIEFILLLVGILLVKVNRLTIGAFIGVWNAAIGTFVYPIMDTSDILSQIAETKTAWENLQSIVSVERENPGNSASLSNPSISIHNLSFQYPNSLEILHNINLSLRCGEIIVIEGESGGGKTTLIRLLLNLLRPTRGRVVIEDKYQGQLGELRRHIAYVPQGNSLLNLSVEDNLLLGTSNNPVSQRKMTQYLQEFNLSSVIQSMSGGLQTVIKEDVQVSEGEAQRLAIIRALMRDVPFLVLDEPFSALDEENILQVVDILNREKQYRGILIVTHREAPGLQINRKYALSGGVLNEQDV